MPSLAELRQQYPQYSDMSDQQFADAFHKKFYADMPREQFDEKVGLKGGKLQAHEERSAAFEGGVLGGIPIIGPAIKGGAERIAAGLRSVTGGKSYAEELKTVQDFAAKVGKEHPVARGAGELTGGMAGMGIAGAAAPAAMGLTGTLPQMITRGGLSGLGIGAADAAVRGENPITGGAVGGVAGAAGPLVSRGVQAAAQPVIQAVRGIRDPVAEGGRRVVAAGDLGVRTGQMGLTPQQFVDARRAGMPVMNLDIGGRPMGSLARSAANTDPGARNILDTALNQRQAQQGERITRFLNTEFHFPDPARTEAALADAAQTVNDAAYKRAYAQGAKGLWSPELERLSGSDAVTSAMKDALGTMRDEAIIGGYGPMRPPFRVDPQAGLVRERSPTGIPIDPDLRFWDLTRRKLSDAAIRAGRGTDEARRLTNFAKALNKELDRLVPSYAEARAGAASFFGAENALEAGQKAVRSRMGNPALRQNLARMKPIERQLFQDGYVGQWVQHIREQPDNRDLGKLFRSPAWRERNEIALGRDKARRVEAMMAVERVMAQSRHEVQGGPTTARQLHELGMAGGYGGLAGIGTEAWGLMSGKRDDHQALVNSFLVYGAARGKAVIDRRVAEQVARLLVSDNPQALMRGIQVVANNTQMMDALITTLTRGAAPAVQRAIKKEPPPAYGGPQQ